MPKIEMEMDADSVKRASKLLSDELAKVKDRIAEVKSTANSFNNEGVQVGSTIRGLTKDGKEFVGVLGLMTKEEKALAAAGEAVGLSLKSMKVTDKKKEIEEVTHKTSALQHAMTRLSHAFQHFVTYKAFNFISRGLQEGVEAAKDFQIQLSLIRTLSQGEGQQSFTAFGRDVRGVSDRTGLDLNEVAKSFYDTTSNQIAKGKNVAPFVETASEFARVTGSQVTDSVNLLSAAINSYGLQAEDAGRLSAIFFKTIDEGRIVASELANTFGRVGVLGSNLGVSIEELNAVLAITTQKGFTTSDAMTLLTNLLIKLEKPTTATSQFFKDLGVDSGEAAVKMLGFPTLIRRMVEAVKSGKVDVSAFFDEIRGRKQFGVFEQSVDEIENFSKRLKDTAAVTREYQEAVKIRGESPADLLVKETNKLKNIFKADLGQQILKVTADLITFLGGVDNVKKNIGDLGPIVRTTVIGLGAYATVMGVVAIANFAGAKSFAVLSASAGTALRIVAPLAAVYGVYRGLDAAFGGKENAFGQFNPAQFDRAADSVERFRKEAEKARDALKGAKFDPLASFGSQGKQVEETYRDVLRILAEATKVNANFLDDAKKKSQEAGNAMKVTFAGWLDGMKARAADFKKVITEANTEIEKSVKSTMKFKDSLDQLLFGTQMKYANDQLGEQKINLTEQQIGRLKSRVKELAAIGTPEAMDEARRLFDDIAKLEAENFDRRQDIRKQELEKYNADRGITTPGANILTVSTEELQAKLNALLAERNAFESKYRAMREKDKVDYAVGVKSQTEINRKMEQAIKAYESIEVFNKDGAIKPEFRSGGKFDMGKLTAAFDKAEDEIRKFAHGTIEERFRLEAQFTDRKRALMKEASAQQRAEDLATSQTKLLSEEDAQKRKLEDLKKSRADLMKTQDELLNAFGSKLGELGSFANVTGQARLSSDEVKEILDAAKQFEKAAQEMGKKRQNKDGILVADAESIELAARKYEEAVLKIIKIHEGKRTLWGKPVDPLELKDSGGRPVTAADAIDVARDDAKRLKDTARKLSGNLDDERSTKRQFEEEVVKPVEKLKALFPELQVNSKNFAAGANADFRSLANGGVDELIKKLKEVQLLMPQMNKAGTPMGFSGELGGGEAYAATGGHVGFFPGQPRGRDKYPIWAEHGEFIVNSRSTAMYKPMLEAINNARAPQYMARGGHVGGDTNVGDINVTVNGGNTNAETGRYIGNRLERDLRRGVIRLKRN